MSYKVIKKMYRTVKDMEVGNAYCTINMTEGWRPITKEQAETVKTKMIQDPLWIYQVLPA